jgi:microcystin-dependent protein
MADPFVAEIRVVGFNFAPKGWAFANGQILPISQNTALFSLLGTTYGGDGKSTFALPDIQGNVVNGPGQGPGLSIYDEGQVGGAESITLLTTEMPFHTHVMQAVPDPADQTNPQPDRALARSKPGNVYQSNAGTNLVPMAPQTLSIEGQSLPHNNMQPYLTLNFVIALQGVFPPRG